MGQALCGFSESMLADDAAKSAIDTADAVLRLLAEEHLALDEEKT